MARPRLLWAEIKEISRILVVKLLRGMGLRESFRMGGRCVLGAAGEEVVKREKMK